MRLPPLGDHTPFPIALNMSESKIVAFPGTETTPVQPPSFDRSAMRSDLLDQASKVVPDIPVLINMISQRVRQLNNGRPPLAQIMGRAGQADIAIMEIIEGKIVLSDNGSLTEFPDAEEA